MSRPTPPPTIVRYAYRPLDIKGGIRTVSRSCSYRPSQLHGADETDKLKVTYSSGVPEPVTLQEAQLSPSDRAMRLVSSNLASCHATVQKLLIRQVLTKLMVWSWRFSRRQCVMNNVHSTMTRRVGSHCLRCHKQTDDGRVVYITCIPTTCCGEIF